MDKRIDKGIQIGRDRGFLKTGMFGINWSRDRI